MDYRKRGVSFAGTRGSASAEFTLTFTEGDGMLSKCGNYFIESVSLNKDSNHEVISALGAFFYPSLVKSFFQADLSIDQFQTNYDTIKVSIDPLMKSFVNSINYILDHPQLADENLLLTKLKELLLLLSKSESAHSIHAFVHSLFVKNEYEFNEIIQQNLYSNLSLQEMAHLSNMSLARFKRKFSEYFKESPAKYILQKKIEKSISLLTYNSKSIADIAFECGFESVSSFDRSFKKIVKISPSKYRMSQNDKSLR